jgi:predicted alpha/beta-fold hydrolase
MTPADVAKFRPSLWLRGRHLQSLLASSSVRRLIDRRRHERVLAVSEDLLLDGGDGARLQGFISRADSAPARGLVVLFHGWEGSAHSAYVLNLNERLLAEGYDVVRINCRDHGGTHHLNREIFHSCRIDEVVCAVRDVARRFPQRPLLSAGFSLGGNFALRVALRAPGAGIALAGVAAVCPAIHPPNVLTAMERGAPMYYAYFMMQWRASLRRKQRLYPELYPFDERVFKLDMRELTRYLIERYTDIPGLDAYFDGYSIAGDRLLPLTVPAAILTSADDPIIPVADFQNLQLPTQVRLDITRYGGHCGFVGDASLKSWAEDWICARLGEFAEADAPAATRAAGAS